MTLADPTLRPRETRANIVDALAAVPGLTAYPTTPDQATAGAAWPKWVQTTYDGPLCSLGVDTYEVFVTLPAAYVANTVDQGDGLRDVVAYQLASTVGRVVFVEPATITFQDRQTMPGLRLRITTR